MSLLEKAQQKKGHTPPAEDITTLKEKKRQQQAHQPKPINRINQLNNQQMHIVLSHRKNC